MQPIATKRRREPVGVGYTRDGSALGGLSPDRLQRSFDAGVGEVLALVEALGVHP